MQCGINATEPLIGGGRLQEETRRIDRDGPIDLVGFGFCYWARIIGPSNTMQFFFDNMQLNFIFEPSPCSCRPAARRSRRRRRRCAPGARHSVLPVAALASALPRKNLTGDTNADKKQL
jgi:hypothetical protein